MDRCPICWEAMTHKNSYCTGICKHTFHGHCLLKWLCFKDPQGPHQLNCCTRRILRAPCPMCRRVLTLHSKHYDNIAILMFIKKQHKLLVYINGLCVFLLCTINSKY